MEKMNSLLKIKPNIILGSDKEKNVIQYNALLLPDFLCFNTGGTFGQNYEQIDYLYFQEASNIFLIHPAQ